MVARADPKRRPVFISHASGDRAFAKDVASELAKAGLSPWFSDDLRPGDNVLLEMGRALESSDALVVLLSPEAAQSPNLTYEVGYAVGSERFANRVIPVMVRPTSEMPWILERFGIIPGGTGAKRVAQQIVERLAPPARA